MTIHFLSLIELFFMFRLILTTNINIIVDVAVLAIQISFHICPLIPFVWILSLGLA